MDENTRYSEGHGAALGRVVVSRAFDGSDTGVTAGSGIPVTAAAPTPVPPAVQVVPQAGQPRIDTWSFAEAGQPLAEETDPGWRLGSAISLARSRLVAWGPRRVVVAAVLVIVVMGGGSFSGVALVRSWQHTQPAQATSQIASKPANPSPQHPGLPVAPTGNTPPSTAPTSTPPPASHPAPSPTPPPPTAPPAPLPSLPPVAGKDTSYSMGVLVLKYFPLTSNGQNINIAVTGDVGDSYASVRQHTIDMTNNLLMDLPKATRYLARTYGGDPPALTYHVVATVEHTTAVPINSTIHPGYPTYPDYYGIMSSHNICNYVDNQGVHEVWLWAYQGPNKPGTNQPYLGIEESKMSGPHGDISNSYEWNDMPVCKHTYVVYTFNYGRGTAEAMHSWGHQIEAEMNAVDSNLFGLFQGPAHPQAQGVTGRCGSVHNPPNSRQEYDYANPTPQASDCDDWLPDSYGKLTQISCAVWGCSDISDSDNSQLNYFIWMWQHLPGRNNTKTYHGKQLRNWWDVHGNFDSVMSSSKHLTM